jgi:small-conductance mechanosensitive channel
MHTWLDRLIPEGPFKAVAVEAATLGARVLLLVAGFLLLRWLALRGLDLLVAPLRARQGLNDAATSRLDTMRGLARSVTTYLLLFVAAVMVLAEFGVNVGALLAGAGVAGLAVSFGAQRLVRDVLTGFFLLLEDQFRVGEVVTLAGVPGLPALTGTVLEMGLRVSRLRDADGKLVTVANGDVAAVVNHSRGPVRVAVELGVPAGTDYERVEQAVASLELPEPTFSGSATLEGVTALDANRMVLRVAAAAAPGQTPPADLELRRLLAAALAAAGIEVR